MAAIFYCDKIFNCVYDEEFTQAWQFSAGIPKEHAEKYNLSHLAHVYVMD